MTKQHLRDIVFRYFLFLLGIFTISLGIAFSTGSGLGTTPLASLPYTLSLVYDASEYHLFSDSAGAASKTVSESLGASASGRGYLWLDDGLFQLPAFLV